MKLSLVIPCYNEERCILPFYKSVQNLSLDYELEFWFVDDGSTDGTLKICETLTQEDSSVHYVSFSRNFGKEAALLAGLRCATGDFIATMDVDLQDPPDFLPEMLAIIRSGKYESVGTFRKSRLGEPLLRSWFSEKFYWIMDHFSEVHLQKNARDFRLMTRKFVNAVLSLSEVRRFTKGIYSWVGFPTKWVAFDNVERTNGITKWSFWKLLIYSLEGIAAFSTAPLQIASVIGILSCLSVFIYIMVVVGKLLLLGEPIEKSTILICFVMLSSAFQLLCTGILGFYLAKIYLEVKHRPMYLVQKKM